MAIPWKPEWESVVRNIELKNVGQGHRYAVPGELKTPCLSDYPAEHQG